jgi:hypothetical protein
MEEHNFLDVLDILIQKKDYLALEPYYRLDPEARAYINRSDKLEYLGVNSFYEGFSNYIFDVVSDKDHVNIVKLWLIVDDKWKNIVAREVLRFYDIFEIRFFLIIALCIESNIVTDDEIFDFWSTVFLQFKPKNMTADEKRRLKYLIIDVATRWDINKSCQILRHLFTVLEKSERLASINEVTEYYSRDAYINLIKKGLKDAADCVRPEGYS